MNWRAAPVRLRAFLERHDLIPPPAPRVGRLRGRRRPWHGAARVLLCGLFAAYLVVWVQGHWGWLADPLLQNDDARTSLFPYHRFGPEGALRDDEIARAMMGVLPPAQHLLYAILVPLAGLFWAAKIVQLLCVSIVAAASVALARARRGGLAAGVLLAFVLLHSPYVIDRMAGGHTRGFTFPLLALWFAGAVARSERCRWTAALLAAPLYFPALGLILGAECLWTLRGGVRWTPALRGRLKRLALLTALCALVLVPQSIATAHQGRPHTLAEARANPAFEHSLRRALPMADPAQACAAELVDPWREAGRSPLPWVQAVWSELGSTGPLLLIAALAALVALRLAPTPWPALVLAGATVGLYAIARIMAFRLYDPQRYCTFGMQAASIMLAVGAVGLIGAGLRDRLRRGAIRQLAAAGFIALLCAVAGDGILAPPEDGMTIDGRRDADLLAFVRTLPIDARIACHPGDGADISFWTARATTDHHETLQPWLVEAWQRSLARTQETLRALYATDLRELAAYCERNGITHLLLNAHRYGDDFRRQARLFAPLDDFTDALLEGRDGRDFAVRQLQRRAVFQHAPWAVVDVRGLAAGAARTAQAGP